MYEIIKEYNPDTLLAEKDGVRCVLKRTVPDDPEVIRRLMKVRSEHLAAVTDTTVIGGELYLVTEYVDGVTLEEHVKAKGTLDRRETVRIAADVCSALEAMHAEGLVHRDVNPSNVMIDSTGSAKLIDPGICRRFSADKSSDTQLLGTPGFAAPEQYGFGQSGVRADVYAVGVLINYMQTGCLPAEKLVSGKLKSIVCCCIQVDEKLRYPDVKSLRNVLLYGVPGGRSIIPGFRQNVTWHKIVAAAYYVFLIVVYSAQLSGSGTPWKKLTWFLSITVCLVVPELVAVNFLNWTDKLKFTLGFSKWQKLLFLAAAGVLTFFLLTLVTPDSWFYVN